MTDDDVMKLFLQRGALLQGHFKLTSGLHSDTYMQCALLLQYGCDADLLGAELARRFRPVMASDKPITAVVSPAVGGIVLGYVVTRALGKGVRAMFAERVDGKFVLRRGFALAPNEQVLIVEDVLTTGGSVREIAEMVESSGAHVAGFAALADRSGSRMQLPATTHALLKLQSLVTYQPDQCALCEQNFPLIKPGSRPEPVRKN